MSYGQLRSFVKTHERTFVIGAAVLAVCALLLKEVVREDLKDLKDSLSAAKVMFAINTGFVGLHRDIGSSHGLTPNHWLDDSDTEALKQEEYRILSSIEVSEAELDNMRQLLEVMKPSPTDDVMLKAAKHAKSAIEEEVEKAKQIVDSQKRLAKLREVEGFAEYENRRTFEFQEKMLSEAEEQERTRDKMYRVVTYITYELLVLAALTGLLGRILDVDRLAESSK
jgi:hypothetical protein